MRKKNNVVKWIGMSFICCVLVISSLSGCASLRKKFTRKKNKEKVEAFIPVLEPINYPPAYISSQQRYSYHYSLWRVWYKELFNTLKDKDQSKRHLYILSQMMTQLQEMQKWIVLEKQKELEPFLKELEEIHGELTQAEPFQSKNKIKRQLSTHEKKILKNFTPKLMHDYYRE